MPAGGNDRNTGFWQPPNQPKKDKKKDKKKSPAKSFQPQPHFDPNLFNNNNNKNSF